MNTISVIVPTFNAAGTLERCLKSLLAQTPPLHEIIVVNDGSTDDSAGIAEAIAKNSKTIHIHNQINSGVSSARNRGLDLATGTYVGFVDPDDHVSPIMYRTMMVAAQLCSAPVSVLSNYAIRPDRMSAIHGRPVVETGAALSAALLMLAYPSGVCYHLYRRTAIGGVRFDARVGFFEDLLFNFEVLLNTDRIACVSEDLYFYEPGAAGANLSPLSDTHLSSFVACRRLRDMVDGRALRCSGELAFLETLCLETVLYKVASSPKCSKSVATQVQRFAREIARRSLVANQVTFRRKALAVAACIAPGILFTSARTAFRTRRWASRIQAAKQ